jgi:glyoxylase-like metal-dependent hydrolase (beta-lactamase superfamily II)
MVSEREFEFITENVLVIFDKTFPLYVLLGDKNFLIDAGPAVMAPEFIKRISRAMQTTNQRFHPGIDTLILTHSHWDHTGGSSFLQNRYGFNVLASRRTVDLLEKPKVIEVIERMNQDFKDLIHEQTDIHFTGLKNLGAVNAGEAIAIDRENHLQVIPTPGHTKCSISLLMNPTRILFPGDAAGLMEPDCTIRPLFFSDYSEYEQSMQKLIDLEANAIAFPHNKRIIGKKQVKDYLEDSLFKTKEVKTEIGKLLTEGMESLEVAGHIYDREFPNLSFMGPRDILIANLESMVKSVAREYPPGEPG